ncbi:MAG: lipocalin-like domain-containing protein [Myxococcota bacterium]|nr:lipocalin-like domain-containing protein [Myxococcota bacterium]
MQGETIVGTWCLDYFELQAPDGSITHPYGENVHGYLVYSPEGVMSAAFMRADRGPQASQDLSQAETAPAWDAFMAYSGPYRVEGDRILHDVEVSSLAVWIGTVQERWFKIDGESLVLHTAPLSVGETAPVGRLVWSRVRKDAPNR